MNIIKLSATKSTNTFLKELSMHTVLQESTVVVAESQSQGRGQLGSQWQSQTHKSLTFSMFRPFASMAIDDQFYISMAVSLSISETLKSLKIPDIAIKWPNDILSHKKKCCGILIENTIKSNLISASIMGIGLNVNETSFKELPDATSMKIASGVSFNISEILTLLVHNLEKQLDRLEHKKFQEITLAYTSQLYGVDKVLVFEDANKKRFNGIIRGVNKQGLLLLENEDEQLKTYNLKELKYCF